MLQSCLISCKYNIIQDELYSHIYRSLGAHYNEIRHIALSISNLYEKSADLKDK